MKTYIYKFFIVLFSAVVFISCEDDLNVENLNDVKQQPNTETEQDIVSLSKELYKSWWIAHYHINLSSSPALALLTMADAGSCSWGNWAMFDLSSEPRSPFVNSVSYQNAAITSSYFNAIMATVANCNKVILAGKGKYKNANTQKNLDLGAEKDKAMAIAYYVRGLCYAYLSANFDRSFVITEDEDLTKTPKEIGQKTIKSYGDVLAQALADFDEAISISNKSEFNIEESVFTNVTSNSQLIKLANSYAARAIVFNPRNKEDNSKIDWSKVLTYAQNGITEDFFVNTKRASGNWGTNDFVNTYNVYAGYWAKIDMRMINLMDPNMENTFPSSGKSDDLTNKGKATSVDKRLETDFSYSPKNNFRAERGYYHYGTYASKKHSYYPYMTQDRGSIQMYKYENDLMIAEAQTNLDNLGAAVGILNEGNRKVKGNIETPASISKDKLLEAISYERQIDLFLSTFGLEFYEMRRNNLLQEGTLLHFPIPADQLNATVIPIYTFGGTIGEPGKDYSNTKGWRK